MVPVQATAQLSTGWARGDGGDMGRPRRTRNWRAAAMRGAYWAVSLALGQFTFSLQPVLHIAPTGRSSAEINLVGTHGNLLLTYPRSSVALAFVVFLWTGRCPICPLSSCGSLTSTGPCHNHPSVFADTRRLVPGYAFTASYFDTMRASLVRQSFLETSCRGLKRSSTALTAAEGGHRVGTSLNVQP